MPHDKIIKWIIALTLVFVVASALLFLASVRDKAYVRIGEHTVTARIADSPEELQKGLSGSAELPEDNGLLLIFDKSDKWAVWMKDMNYSIDIIWIDESYKIVDVKANVTPSTYPTQFLPKQAAKYVLEVPAGFIERHTINPNMFVTIQTWHW